MTVSLIKERIRVPERTDIVNPEYCKSFCSSSILGVVSNKYML